MIRSLGEPCARDGRAQRLWLRATDDGWSLTGPNGDLVFRSQGTRSRRACLEFAREHGIFAVFT